MLNHPKEGKQATPNDSLEEQIVSSTFPKNEREWWAHHEIDRLRAEVASIKGRVDNATQEVFRQTCEENHSLRVQLAAAKTELGIRDEQYKKDTQQITTLGLQLSAANEKLEHTNYWYGCRSATLFDWAHKKLPEDLRHDYFSIVANGSAGVNAPPTYAQQYNMMQHRAEKAEKELAAAKVEFLADDAPLSDFSAYVKDVPKEWATKDVSWVVKHLKEETNFDAALIEAMLNFAISAAQDKEVRNAKG